MGTRSAIHNSHVWINLVIGTPGYFGSSNAAKKPDLMIWTTIVNAGVVVASGTHGNLGKKAVLVTAAMELADIMLGKDVEFKEYDESAADDVQLLTCPKCGHSFPK